MALIIDWENVDGYCRTCLSQIQPGTHNIFQDQENQDSINRDIAELLSRYLTLKMDPLDDLPKNLCNSCYNMLMSFENFKVLALHIDKKLREHLENSGNKKGIRMAFAHIDYVATEQNSIIKDFQMKQDINSNDPYIACKFDSDNDSSDEVIFKSTHNDLNGEEQICIDETNLEETHINGFKVKGVNESFMKSRKKCHMKRSTLIENQCQEKHTMEVAQNYVQCDKCGQKFKSVHSLSAHKRKHAPKNRVLMCTICKKPFKKVSHLKRHELTHTDNPFKCDECPKSFSTEMALVEHFNKHNGVKPEHCPICNKSFSHLSTLNNHLRIHTRDSPYLCQTCGRKFTSSTNLKQHVARHIGLKSFACDLCPKKFVSKGDLKTHQPIHTGERPHICNVCSSTFTSRGSLWKHKWRHSGQKPHHCNTCPMKFAIKEHLKRHLRIHTGERPHKCDLCDRAFKQSNDLVKHKRGHLGINMYRCDQCSRSFRLQTELRRHTAEHYMVSRQNVEHSGTRSTTVLDGVSKVSVEDNIMLNKNAVLNEKNIIEL